MAHDLVYAVLLLVVVCSSAKQHFKYVLCNHRCYECGAAGANCDIAISSEKCHSEEAKYWESAIHCESTVINKCFVINMILFVTLFVLCSNMESTNYFFHKYFK